ncbi:MAG TPA: hypothetical protein VN520_13465 [Streptomyces sp.]|uniref:hypothetical protein n=1 Tax=Streptomyces sp. TaxID=1931 RepID=UPI002B64D535|nr:hypothetical protein [Streptomyces sp.]HWU07364.1 hypothetical protein [Streptomyces sp.]
MTAWQLADLLGVHEHQIDLDELPDLPVRVLLALARRLDLNPADLMAGADDLFERPRQREVLDRRPPGAACDTLTWNSFRLAAALDHARTHPDAGGALALRYVPPDG